jgi:Domain of unknown function (DUF4390)
MPCFAAVCQLPGHRAARRPGWVFAFTFWLCLLLATAPLSVRAQVVEVLDLKARRDEVAVSLDYQLRVTLPPAVEDAALRGVPIYFTAQASLWRPRWYWRDERVVRATRAWRLSFQPLTATWRVSQGGLGQSFPNLAEALVAMTRSTGWRIADAQEVDVDGRHYIEFSWRLDTTQLPRPMQIGLGGIGGASEWSLGVERNIKLAAETPK